ncbi:MAG: nucleotidyl transferase AbiEii/AbiGii toxin family protein [Acidimicrobiia bacterium]
MITAGYLALHSQGRRGGNDVALLDVCQDYALKVLHDHDIFDFGVVLKGGTALRKFRAGSAGRFSTDLDFATPDVGTADLLIDTLDGAELLDVRMRVVDRETLRGRLEFETPLGNPRIPAKLELSARPLRLPTPAAEPMPLAVHKGYDFEMPAIPISAAPESAAEKLAAWRRRQKMRDLYDLHWFGHVPLDETLIRRIFVLKVWHDVVNDGLGRGPLDPAEVIADIDASRRPTEDIGLLTQEVDPVSWLAFVRDRYRFLTDLDDDERRVAACSPGDRYFVEQLVDAIRAAAQ